jgi:hypothetical protein
VVSLKDVLAVQAIELTSAGAARNKYKRGASVSRLSAKSYVLLVVVSPLLLCVVLSPYCYA